MSVNLVVLHGRLGQDPELKHVGEKNTAVTKFSLATTHGEKTIWLDVQVWDKQAENVCKFLKKGSECIVQGRLDKRSYEKDGQKHWVTDIVATNVQFVGGKREGADTGTTQVANGGATPNVSTTAPEYNLDQIPF